MLTAMRGGTLNVNGAGSITGNIRVGNLDTNGTIISTNLNIIGNANLSADRLVTEDRQFNNYGEGV
jgi:hypothetical protein